MITPRDSHVITPRDSHLSQNVNRRKGEREHSFLGERVVRAGIGLIWARSQNQQRLRPERGASEASRRARARGGGAPRAARNADRVEGIDTQVVVIWVSSIRRS